MTKLEAAIACGKHPQQAQLFKEMYGVPYWEVLQDASRAYSALQKLAPEIGALVEVIESFKRIVADAGYGIRSGDYELMNPEGYKEDIAKHYKDVDAVISALTTLKAIHDNLKMWGE